VINSNTAGHVGGGSKAILKYPANQEPLSALSLANKDPFFEKRKGKERLNYAISSTKNSMLYRREQARSVLDSAGRGPEFPAYPVSKDGRSSRGNFADFGDAQVRDKSRFCTQNKNLEEKILGRLLGPDPSDTYPSSIMDSQTVNGIKEARKKVLQENKNLRKQMNDMAGVMEKTSGEN
jgi:hypothetical protein